MFQYQPKLRKSLIKSGRMASKKSWAKRGENGGTMTLEYRWKFILLHLTHLWQQKIKLMVTIETIVSMAIVFLIILVCKLVFINKSIFRFCILAINFKIMNKPIIFFINYIIHKNWLFLLYLFYSSAVLKKILLYLNWPYFFIWFNT